MGKKILGEEHPEIARYSHNIAGVQVKQNKLADAEKSYREALALERKFYGAEHHAAHLGSG
jgi:hypothetical protein